MVQLELLWVAAALMLLGATVSLCVKCQHSGKVIESSHVLRSPARDAGVGWRGHATQTLSSWDVSSGWVWFCSAECQLQELCPRGGAASAGRRLCW